MTIPVLYYIQVKEPFSSKLGDARPEDEEDFAFQKYWRDAWFVEEVYEDGVMLSYNPSWGMTFQTKKEAKQFMAYLTRAWDIPAKEMRIATIEEDYRCMDWYKDDFLQ